uniref:Uncharacterized protein n=1 Tax=Nyssomyia neivai TaxID=330878 RepID=A0A1L8DCE3_9DIPT
MERGLNSAAGPKVSQIANIFQRKPIEVSPPMEDPKETQQPQTPVSVVRTESHAARFNNARALFEKLGVENRVPRPTFSVKLQHSSSREENLNEMSPERVSRGAYPVAATCGSGGTITNGVTKIDTTKIHNVSRLKGEKPEKPEKPERKFNSRELIEKQKNWTSHFSKTRTTRYNSDPNRCDIIRTVPGTTLISAEVLKEQPRSVPPEVPRYPDIKPRFTRPTSVSSPTRCPSIGQMYRSPPESPGGPNAQPPSPARSKIKDDIPEKRRKKSQDLLIEPPLPPEPDVTIMNTSNESDVVSPACGLSSTSSPVASASSGPTSPIHTEDEKQENESNEKLDKLDVSPPSPGKKRRSAGRCAGKIPKGCTKYLSEYSRCAFIEYFHCFRID